MSERISGYLKGDLLEKFKSDMERLGLNQSGLLRKVISDYYAKNIDCPALSIIDGYYWCIWGRLNKTPDMKKLGKMREEKNDICTSCKRTLALITENKMLKDELGRPMEIEYYTCEYGGQTRKEGSEIYCKDPRKSAQWRSVKGFCEKINCKSLRKSHITVQRDVK